MEAAISKKKKLKKKLSAAASGAVATAEKPSVKVRDYGAHVLVCTGGDCKKRGAKDVRKAFKDGLRSEGMLGEVRLDETGCLGLCKHGPNIVVHCGAEPGGSWYLGLDEDDIPEVVEQHLERGEPVQRLVAEKRPRKKK